jgi:nicotinate-nucleotide adenylyltransferase
MRRVGLLGGSFNPAHAGHRQVSLEVMQRYGLDEVWWLVSPGNPLKSPAELADYATRLASARAMARHPRIRVSDAEARFGMRYTIDTLNALQRRHPGVRFVWIMGADNLAQFHRWKQWQVLAGRVDMIVVDRKPWTHGALRGRAATWAAGRRLAGHQAFSAGPSGARKWRYHFGRISPLSATQLRKTLGKNAFLGHNNLK